MSDFDLPFDDTHADTFVAELTPQVGAQHAAAVLELVLENGFSIEEICCVNGYGPTGDPQLHALAVRGWPLDDTREVLEAWAQEKDAALKAEREATDAACLREWKAIERLTAAAVAVTDVLDEGERDPTWGESQELEAAAINYGRTWRASNPKQ